MISKPQENLLAGLEAKHIETLLEMTQPPFESGHFTLADAKEIENLKIRYLIIEFGDNDYGIPMIAALQRLWQYVSKNAHVSSRIPEFFKKLHAVGALEPMLMRLFVLEQACSDVEHLTRCLEWDFDKKELPETRLEYYLECPVKFSADLPKPNNGEDAWMDLETGEADCV